MSARGAGDEESARGRLLNAATRLFCRYGINATGIDAIIHEAGTAKTTLYKLFGSKTNLVHAVLESEGNPPRLYCSACELKATRRCAHSPSSSTA